MHQLIQHHTMTPASTHMFATLSYILQTSFSAGCSHVILGPETTQNKLTGVQMV